MAVTVEVMAASTPEGSTQALPCMPAVSDILAGMVLPGRASMRPSMRITTAIISIADSTATAMGRPITTATRTATAEWYGLITGRVRFAAIVPGITIGAITIAITGAIGR